MIAVEGLTVNYNGKVKALRDVTFSLPEGASCAIIGPSGCGKSTLLQVLAGLIPPSAGAVAIGGEPVSSPRRQTGLILQDYGLLPWKTVWQNAILGLQIRGEDVAHAERALRDLGLWDFRDRYPAQLSGGQRQRVAIARALALRPDLLLMDEPFSSLDALTREGLQQALLDIWRRGGVTLVLVTHSIEEAVFLGQRILVLSPGPGRVVAEIPNPGAGRNEYRREPEFYARCTQVRDALERGVGDAT